MCKIKDCSLDKYENFENCILHCKKDDWYDGRKKWGKSKDKIDKFLEKIKDVIYTKTESYKIDFQEYSQEEIVDELKEYKFEKVYFPPIKKNTNPFPALNQGLAEENKLNINFIECHFLGKIDFDCIVKAKDINFDNCYFYEDIEFKSNTFNHLFLFEKCIVHKKIEFQNIIFNGTTSFIETSFNGDFDLVHSKFESLALFNDMKINKFKIDNTFFKDEANFLNIKNKDEEKLESKNIDNRETARIIKHSFEKQNNIIEANKFYALEMQKKEKELKWNISDFSEKLVFMAHKISSNYSQDWILSLLLLVFITLTFNYFNNILLSLVDVLVIFIFAFIVFIPRNILKFLLSMMIFLLYYFDNIDLDLFAKTINPFSKISADINISQLIIKIIMAYLIYQFIISIRQNTRRK